MFRTLVCRVFVLCLLPLPVSAATVTLGWNWDAPSAPPMGYVVERKLGFSGEYVVVGSPIERTWTDTDVPEPTNQAVYWRVKAVHELGITKPSNEISLSLSDAPQDIRMVVQTFGPSATAPRVSARVRVKKSDQAAPVPQRPGRTKGKK